MNKFCNYYKATHICERDSACSLTLKTVDPEFVFTNCGRRAGWRKSQITHQMYLIMTPAHQLSPYIPVPGWHLDICWGDIMHDLFGGVGKDEVATTLVELVEHKHVLARNGMPFDTEDEAYAALSVQLPIWCKENNLAPVKLKLSKHSLGRDHKTDFPEVGNEFKCAHVKIMIPFVASMCRCYYGACLISRIRESKSPDLTILCRMPLSTPEGVEFRCPACPNPRPQTHAKFLYIVFCT